MPLRLSRGTIRIDPSLMLGAHERRVDRSWRFLMSFVLFLGTCTTGGDGQSVPSSPRTPNEHETVRLVTTRPAVLRFCQIGANQLGRPVPCPTLVPAHPLSPDTELCVGADTQLGGPGCFRGGAFLMQEVFVGPDSYEGLVANDGSVSNIGHMNIWSSEPTIVGEAGLGCRGHGEEVGKTVVRGHPGVWVSCPENRLPPQDSGHVMLQWLDDGILYTVSLHRDSAANRLLTLAIARHLVLVHPRGSVS